MKNPFEGVTPDISVFGQKINSLTVTLLGGVWGLVLVAIALYTLVGIAKWAAARQNARSEEMTEAAGKFKIGLIAFACAVGISVIFGAIIFIFG